MIAIGALSRPAPDEKCRIVRIEIVRGAARKQTNCQLLCPEGWPDVPSILD